MTPNSTLIERLCDLHKRLSLCFEGATGEHPPVHPWPFEPQLADLETLLDAATTLQGSAASNDTDVESASGTLNETASSYNPNALPSEAMVEALLYVRDELYLNYADKTGRLIARIDEALAMQSARPIVPETICQHEPYQGKCAHCDIPFRDGCPIVPEIQDTGVPASPSGCQPSASAVEEVSSQSGVPNAVTISGELYAFLLGQGPIEGTWFGDLNAGLGRRGRFWWRALLRCAARASKS